MARAAGTVTDAAVTAGHAGGRAPAAGRLELVRVARAVGGVEGCREWPRQTPVCHDSVRPAD
jgi:hypothetical protein